MIQAFSCTSDIFRANSDRKIAKQPEDLLADQIQMEAHTSHLKRY